MADILKIISRVDEVKPNGFSQKVKLGWIAELDGLLALNVLLRSGDDVQSLEYRYPEDLQRIPLVSFPHSAIYDAWLSAKIDLANGEYDRYQNAMEHYNALYDEFVKWYVRTHDPAASEGAGGM